MNTNGGILAQANAWLIRIFAAFWMAFLTVDYLQASDFIANGLKLHAYMDTFFILICLSVQIGLDLCFHYLL